MKRCILSCVILGFFIQSNISLANEIESLDDYFNKFWQISSNDKKNLLNSKILANATVKSDEKQQFFNFNAAALHPKRCRKAIRKLSRLEEYATWIDFIKSSTYQEQNQLFTLKADHFLLPYPMIIHIFVARPTSPGRYPFTFPTGIFSGLQGFFEIKKYKNRCVFYAESSWRGAKTNIPDFVIELFSETLAKLGGDVLIRKSR